jgi:hypothetical protein
VAGFSKVCPESRRRQKRTWEAGACVVLTASALEKDLSDRSLSRARMISFGSANMIALVVVILFNMASMDRACFLLASGYL